MSIFDIRQNGRRADIYLYGSITKYPYGRGDESAATLIDTVTQLDAEEIHLHIDSMGGSVAEGWGMYNALLRHPAKVTTYADGFVASAALYPYLAGDVRIASSVSAFYLHEAGTSASGYASDLRNAADQIELLTDIGINAFVDRTGQSREKISQLMQRETTLTAAESLALGLSTVITQAEASQAYTQSVMDSVVQALKSYTAKPKPTPVNRIKKFFA